MNHKTASKTHVLQAALGSLIGLSGIMGCNNPPPSIPVEIVRIDGDSRIASSPVAPSPSATHQIPYARAHDNKTQQVRRLGSKKTHLLSTPPTEQKSVPVAPTTTSAHSLPATPQATPSAHLVEGNPAPWIRALEAIITEEYGPIHPGKNVSEIYSAYRSPTLTAGFTKNDLDAIIPRLPHVRYIEGHGIINDQSRAGQTGHLLVRTGYTLLGKKVSENLLDISDQGITAFTRDTTLHPEVADLISRRGKIPDMLRVIFCAPQVIKNPFHTDTDLITGIYQRGQSIVNPTAWAQNAIRDRSIHAMRSGEFMSVVADLTEAIESAGDEQAWMNLRAGNTTGLPENLLKRLAKHQKSYGIELKAVADEAYQHHQSQPQHSPAHFVLEYLREDSTLIDKTASVTPLQRVQAALSQDDPLFLTILRALLIKKYVSTVDLNTLSEGELMGESRTAFQNLLRNRQTANGIRSELQIDAMFKEAYNHLYRDWAIGPTETTSTPPTISKDGRTIRIVSPNHCESSAKDTFPYAHTRVTGDFSLEATVSQLSTVSNSPPKNAKAFLILRESTDPASQYVSLQISKSGSKSQIQIIHRTGTGSQPASYFTTDEPDRVYALRLERKGREVRFSYEHGDGRSFTISPLTCTYPQHVEAGIGAGSIDPTGEIIFAQFEHLALKDSSQPGLPRYPADNKGGLGSLDDLREHVKNDPSCIPALLPITNIETFTTPDMLATLHLVDVTYKSKHSEAGTFRIPILSRHRDDALRFYTANPDIFESSNLSTFAGNTKGTLAEAVYLLSANLMETKNPNGLCIVEAAWTGKRGTLTDEDWARAIGLAQTLDNHHYKERRDYENPTGLTYTTPLQHIIYDVITKPKLYWDDLIISESRLLQTLPTSRVSQTTKVKP